MSLGFPESRFSSGPSTSPSPSPVRVSKYAVQAFHITHLITIIPATQLHFMANKNAEQAGGSQ